MQQPLPEPLIKQHKDMLENPTEVNSLIEYQAGVVASRTVIDRKTGTVTIFSFDEAHCLKNMRTEKEMWE